MSTFVGVFLLPFLRAASTSSSTRSLRRASKVEKAVWVSGPARRHLASTMASSIAIEAPWPALGRVAWAASPIRHTGPLCQVGKDGMS